MNKERLNIRVKEFKNEYRIQFDEYSVLRKFKEELEKNFPDLDYSASGSSNVNYYCWIKKNEFAEGHLGEIQKLANSVANY